MEDRVLVHHGVDGQEWGKRKYQNSDGSLTPLGRIHYGVGEARDRAKIKMKEEKAKAKNEIKIAKAKAKAEAAKIKAEAKAYKIRKSAETQAERDRIKAEADVEKERIKSEENKEKYISEENQNIAKAEANKQAEIAEASAEASKTESRSKVMKVALTAAAATGIAYLLYKSLKGFKGDTAKESISEKAASVIDSVKDSTVSAVTSAADSVFSSTSTPTAPKESESSASNNSSNTTPKETTNSTSSSIEDYIKKLSNTPSVVKSKENRYGGETANETKIRKAKELIERAKTEQARNEKFASENLKNAFRSMVKSSSKSFDTDKKKTRPSSGIVNRFIPKNDKARDSNKKTKYYYDDYGNYVKATKESNGTYTERLSNPTSSANKYLQKLLKRTHARYTKHSDYEGLILIHSIER